jgi:hypothetical protein
MGNSTAVRIPAAVLEASRGGGRPDRDRKGAAGALRYRSLTAGITGKNRHGPVDMGKLAHGEVW